MTELPFALPVLAISPAQHPWTPEGVEELHCVERLVDLTGGAADENLRRLAWEIIDGTGARWRIAESPEAAVARGLMTPTSKFEPSFESLGKARLAEVKARVVAAVRGTPELFLDDEILAGEANYPIEDRDVLLDAVCTRIEGARTFKALIKAVWADQSELEVVRPYPEADVAEDWRQIIVFWIKVLSGGGFAFICFFVAMKMLPPPYADVLSAVLALAVAGFIVYWDFRTKAEARRTKAYLEGLEKKRA